MRGGRSDRGELDRRAGGAEVSIGIEWRPLAKLRRIGECLPDCFRRVTQLSDQDQRPLFSVLFDLRAGRTRR